MFKLTALEIVSTAVFAMRIVLVCLSSENIPQEKAERGLCLAGKLCTFKSR